MICGTRTRTTYPVNIPGRTWLGESSHRYLQGMSSRQAFSVQCDAPCRLLTHKGQHYLLMPKPFVGTFVVHHCIFDHAWQTIPRLAPAADNHECRMYSYKICLRITGVVTPSCAFLQALRYKVKKMAFRSKHSM